MSLVTHPDSWSEITLGEINQYRSKNVQPKDFPEESFELWSVPIFPTGKPETLVGAEIGSSKQAVEPSDVLICKINPRINRVWEVGQKSSHRQIASSEWIVVRQPLMEPRYLLRFFQSDQFRAKLCADVTGVGGSLTRAQPKKVATFPVVVPPLAEQKVIADKLDTLLAQVENTKARLERIPQILKRFRQSVLAAAVSGRLTGMAHISRWERVTVGRIANDIRYGTSKKCSESTGSTPVLRIPNIGDGYILQGNLKFADFEEKERTKLALKRGDLLVIRSNGSLDLVGKTALVRKKDAGLLYAGYLIRLRLDEQVADPEYVSLSLRGPEIRAVIEEKARSTSGVNNINSKELASLEISLPSLEAQCEIVHRVNQLFAPADRIEQQVQGALERVNHLTQSILAKAFRGELTEQWRKDNPELISGENSAEALLERIKAERAAMKPAKRTRKSKTSA